MKSKPNTDLKEKFDREFNNARKMWEAELKQDPVGGVVVFADQYGIPARALPVWNN